MLDSMFTLSPLLAGNADLTIKWIFFYIEVAVAKLVTQFTHPIKSIQQSL